MAREVIILSSESDYERALDEIEKFFEIEPRSGTPEAERFDELAQAIAAYESRHWAISEQAAQTGRTQSRLATARTTRIAGGSGMAGKRDYHVVPNSDRGGWDVKREGADRSSGHFDRKSEAMERGKDLARENRTELVEHGRDGRIRDSDSYGNDPLPPRDRKH